MAGKRAGRSSPPVVPATALHSPDLTGADIAPGHPRANGRKGKRALADFHLWDEVAASVTPLRPKPRKRRLADTPLPLPPAENPAPRAVKTIAMPSYQPAGTPGTPKLFPSIEPRLKRKLQRGRVEIDGTLDLHGMRQDEAQANLRRYLKARAARGDRTILVITGKGLKKVDGDPTNIVERGVLRTMLPIWLSAPDLAPLIAGWDMSHQSHGGEGAYYVRLKRERAS